MPGLFKSLTFGFHKINLELLWIPYMVSKE